MANWELDTNRHINLFKDDKAFDAMTAVSDMNSVDVIKKGKESNTKGIHTALLAAGMTPAYGNIADVADAALYALEGEFGEAAWSMAAAIPIVGQMVAGRRAAKVAKEAGEEMVTLYRGVDKWHPGKMVKEGNFVGGGKYYKSDIEKLDQDWLTHKPQGLFTSKSRTIAEINFGVEDFDYNDLILEFEVPESFIKKFGREGWIKGKDIIFDEGIPRGFLKKVHK